MNGKEATVRDRPLVLVMLTLCWLWLAAGAAQAQPPTQQARDLRAARAGVQPRAVVESRLGARAVSAPQFTVGSATVTGHLYDYATGAPVPGAGVYIGWPENSATTWSDPIITDAGGSFTYPTALGTSQGLIMAYPPDPADPGGFLHDYYLLKNLTFSDGGTVSYDLRPGQVGFRTTLSSSFWGSWSDVWVYTSGSGGEARTVFDPTAVGSLSGPVWAMPPDTDYAVAYYWSNEAAEVTAEPPIAVDVGATSAGPLSVDEDAAYRMRLTKPFWGSGKPGTTVTLAYSGWPSGAQAKFMGYSDWPSTAAATTWSDRTITSAGSGNHTLTLRIPTTAKPGYFFDVEMWKPQTPVWIDLTDFFQVCTLNASRTSLHRGAAVRLSGVVPIQGHYGSTPGKATYVTLYKRTTAVTAAPTVWNPTSRGWVRVGAYKTTTSGAYHTGYLRPTRSTWYVARYPGDDTYWGAYTSVRKVRVY